jgi:hypothetical protein
VAGEGRHPDDGQGRARGQDPAALSGIFIGYPSIFVFDRMTGFRLPFPVSGVKQAPDPDPHHCLLYDISCLLVDCAERPG